MDVGAWWGEVWQRAPLPDVAVVLATGVAALLLVLARPTWPWVRLGVTVVHEAGHAITAVLVGRRLQGIRLHADTSGLTVTRGRPTGPGMVATLVAGYLAPAALGVGVAALLAAGRGVAMLWLLLLLLASLLVWVRNWYGVVTLVVAGAGIALLTTYAEPDVQTAVAYLVAWLLLLAAPRPVLELIRAGRRRSPTSDVDQLARLTHVPGLAGCLLMLLANLGGLLVGAAALAPDLRWDLS